MKMIFNTYEEFKNFATNSSDCPSIMGFTNVDEPCEPPMDCCNCWRNCGLDIEIKEELKNKICIIYSPSYGRARNKLDGIIKEKREEGIFTYTNSKIEAIFEDGEHWKIVCNSANCQGFRWSKCLIEEWTVTVGVLNRIILPHAADGCRDNVEYF